MTQPEEFVFDTITVYYGAVTVDVTGTQPAAGTVLFELLSPRSLSIDGVDVTPLPVTGFIGEDGSMRRTSRVGEEGVPLMTPDGFDVDHFTYRATFNLTDGAGRGQINKRPKTFTVSNDDVELGER